MKFKLLKPTSSDAGEYGAMKEFRWEEAIVEGRWCDGKKTSIYVKGKEFIDKGGVENVGCFVKELEYMWGTFEEKKDD